MKGKKPEIRSTEEERAYWVNTETTPDVLLKGSQNSDAGGLRLPVKSICLRQPGVMLEELRVQSNLMDVPQQSLMKTCLAVRIRREMMRE